MILGTGLGLILTKRSTLNDLELLFNRINIAYDHHKFISGQYLTYI